MFNNFFPKVYQIMWEKYGRARQITDENKIWRMRFTYWITKVTDRHTHTHTNRIHNTNAFSTVKIVSRAFLNYTLKRRFPLLLIPIAIC
jgi:hypothetical protein